LDVDRSLGSPTRRLSPSHAVVALAAAVGFAILAACAALPPRNPPRIEVVGVQLDRIEGPDAYFTVVLELTNAADEDIVVQSMQGTLALEDVEVANAVLASSPVRIPARGAARAELASRTGMDQVLRAVAAAMRRGAALSGPNAPPTLRYSLEAAAVLAGGYRLRFSRSGEIGESRR
jgi:LEA14-like dessication related protein